MKLSANAVRLAYAFAAKEDIRYYLNAVSIEPAESGGALITASNGHRLTQVLDRDATNVQAMILSLDKASQAALKRGAWVSTEFDATRVAILDAESLPIHLQIENYRVEAQYPDWRRILGNREQWVRGIGGSFNNTLLADVIRLVDQCVDKGARATPPYVTFYSKTDAEGNRSANDALLFVIDSRVKAWGLVMPARAHGGEDPLAVAYGKAA